MNLLRKAYKLRNELPKSKEDCAWYLIDENGKEHYNEWMCFAPFTREKGTETERVVKYFVCKPIRQETIRTMSETAWEVALRYIHWLANKSVYSEAFITKKARFILDKGAVFRTDFPAPFIVQAASALRYVNDHFGRVVLWDRVRKHIHGDAAFLYVQFFHPDSVIKPYREDLSFTQYYKSPCVPHEVMFYRSIDKGVMNAFINRHIVKGMRNFEVSREYRPLVSCWKHRGGGERPIFPEPKADGRKGRFSEVVARNLHVKDLKRDTATFMENFNA